MNIRSALTIAGLVAASTAAHAVTYNAASSAYNSTGPFTVCDGGTCQNYSTAMQITGFFETAAPLPANLNNAGISGLVTNYSFNDGIEAYQAVSLNTRKFQFSATTNGSGVLTQANIFVEKWLSGAAPHAVNDRLAYLLMTTGASQATRNERCTTIGTSPAGAPDSCTGFAGASGRSTATGSGVNFVAAAAPAAGGVASIPTVTEWGLILMSAALALIGLATLRRRTGI
ncbi:IPTL-CTERM sorting domain-containing protein [Xylophilus sp. Leaf220]|uniref:IPTL-CTERM sorting domain-containing protein n=1 Tax=Xylophilus sp. Leaf220 TaxID=1735686 RepID=UPI0006F63D03|nr:IPTL-CTERM sorting domain-containing protein [Xylophilus sp. Leaf220]KQM80041.1 hypothetical protein ASE76_02375 [Xylophilus sp. Leaf220]